MSGGKQWALLLGLHLVCFTPHSSAAESAKPINPDKHGVFTLTTDTVELKSKSIKRDEKTSSLIDFQGRTDQANWKVSSPKIGNYDVAVTWAVADDASKQGYAIEVDHLSTIRAFTVSTGGTSNFKREIVGRIMLAPGVRNISFFGSGKAVHGELCKLRQIELVPVENLATSAPSKPLELNVPAGFTVEQIAGPPLTSRPMLATFDDRGRMYVAESTGVNADASVLAQSPPHEIRMLEDTDGDGKFDKSTVFADKLTFPQGILWHDGSIYASSPPNFWRFTDTDSDNIADKREVLATGFPFRGMSDDMHGASLGRDGRIYFACGRFPHKIHSTNGPVVHDGHNPLIVRCKPDGSELEVFCGAMGNAVGVDFSDTGDAFASGTFGVNAESKRDVLNHCVDGGAYPCLGQVVNEHKMTGPEMPNLTQFGASASSDLMLYRDEAFGPQYRGNLFSAMFNMHKIARHVLEPDGATYRCRNEDFLTSPDADFHPTDVLEDADGSLVVVHTGAWFLIGCPTSVIAKPQLAGGIYRVRRTDAKPVEDPRGTKLSWSKLSNGDLTKLLDDSRFAVRDRAVQALATRGNDAVDHLQNILINKSTPLARTNAVWALARIGTSEAANIARTALADSDEGVRQSAATAAGLLRDKPAVSTLSQLARTDKSAPVRREAAGALGRIGDTKAVPELLASLADVSDRFLDHALILALIRLDDRQQTVAGLTDRNPEVRRGALIALDQMDHGKLTQSDVTQALEIGSPRLQQAALQVIAGHQGWANQITKLSTKWLADAELPKEQQQSLRGVLLAFISDKSIDQMIARTLAGGEHTPLWTRLLLLDVIAQSEVKALPADWKQELIASLGSENADVARAAVTAISAVNQSVAKKQDIGGTELLALARNSKYPDDLRVAAASAAIHPNQQIDAADFDLLAAQCKAEVEPVTRLAAANTIGAATLDDRQRERLIELIVTAGPLEMPALLRPFENAEVGPLAGKLVAALLKAPGSTSIPADRLMKLVEKLPPNVRTEADTLLARSHVDLQAQKQRLEELKDALNGGDADRGRNLFNGTKATCSACHRIGEEGGRIGPNLAGIGDIRTRRDLLEAVTFPSASFARNFEPYTVTTTSGITHSGIISRTTSDALYLITTERATIRIPRSEIEPDGIVPAQVSIMPQGLDRILTPEELRDILAFLSSQHEQK